MSILCIRCHLPEVEHLKVPQISHFPREGAQGCRGHLRRSPSIPWFCARRRQSPSPGTQPARQFRVQRFCYYSCRPRLFQQRIDGSGGARAECLEERRVVGYSSPAYLYGAPEPNRRRCRELPGIAALVERRLPDACQLQALTWFCFTEACSHALVFQIP